MLPLTAASIEQAIEINGVGIKMNTQAFQLGRLAAADPARIAAMMKGHDTSVAPKTQDAMSLDEIIAHRSALLTDYQNAALAARYRNAVTQVRNAALNAGFGDLSYFHRSFRKRFSMPRPNVGKSKSSPRLRAQSDCGLPICLLAM